MTNWKRPSTFGKMVAGFILLGVLPLLLVCTLFLARYEANARQSTENAMEEANRYAQAKVDDLLTDIDRSMEYLYSFKVDGVGALCDVLEDPSLNENERSMYVCTMLDYFINSHPTLVSAAYFVTPGGTPYVRIYGQQKSLAAFPYDHHRLANDDPSRLRKPFLLPAANEGDWCVGSNDRVVTLARNYMDTRSAKAVTSKVLGTLYLDIRTDALDSLFSSLKLGAKGNAAIVEGYNGQPLYQLREEVYIPVPQQLDFRGGSFANDGYRVYYQPVLSSSYHLMVSFDRQELTSIQDANRLFLIMVLVVAALLIGLLGTLFSGRVSKPARQLRDAMARVEDGDLNVRVDIRSRDELEELGHGFNRMVEELGETIQEVYVAQLCQRDAELNALKMQIQPHYLYNTLDVIRMSALEQDDAKTARLIESLSSQLRYVMGSHKERVPLRLELDAIREYAVLMEARYEGRIQIRIEVNDEDLDLLVPKLLIQPFVENAIKHGLRGKPEGGTVLVEADRLPDALMITILNDGIPILPDRLEHIRRFLETSPVGAQDPENIVSVGMKTTYDRIKINCGRDYGFTLDSGEGMGAIVTVRLPIWKEALGNVESDPV